MSRREPIELSIVLLAASHHSRICSWTAFVDRARSSGSSPAGSSSATAMIVITRRWAPSGSTSSTLVDAASSSGSWARIRCSSWRSSPEGSIPSSRVRTVRGRWKARNVSLWCPEAYSACMSWLHRLHGADARWSAVPDRRSAASTRRSTIAPRSIPRSRRGLLVDPCRHRLQAVEIDVGIRLPRHIARSSVSRSHRTRGSSDRACSMPCRNRRIDAHVAQCVPTRQRDDVRPAQQLAQLGDVLLHHLAGRWGSGAPPELVDDAVCRDDVRRVGGEQREEIAGVWSARQDSGSPARRTTIEPSTRTSNPGIDQERTAAVIRRSPHVDPDTTSRSWAGRIQREMTHLSGWEADTAGMNRRTRPSELGSPDGDEAQPTAGRARFTAGRSGVPRAAKLGCRDRGRRGDGRCGRDDRVVVRRGDVHADRS